MNDYCSFCDLGPEELGPIQPLPLLGICAYCREKLDNGDYSIICLSMMHLYSYYQWSVYLNVDRIVYNHRSMADRFYHVTF